MSGGNAPKSELRLADLVAALSLATDLAMGQPLDHALRTCLLATHLGRALGLDDAALNQVYYVALLRRIGCTGDAHELQVLFGDDLSAHARVFTLDFGRPLDVLGDMLRRAGAGQALPARLRLVVGALLAGPEAPRHLFAISCEVAQQLGQQLGFEEPILTALGQTFERWDGRGLPNGLEGEQVTLAARVAQVAEDGEVLQRLAGTKSARTVLRERAGRWYDPVVANAFCERAERWFDELTVLPAWDAVLEREPEPWRLVSTESFDRALQTMARFADLKSPFTSGHSTGVADLVTEAARQCRLPEPDILAVRRAALLHDLGRVGISSSIWEKRGALTFEEWEQVRLHSYYTERILARSQTLSPLGSLAALHHERLDGSGYYRRIPGNLLPLPARLLAAADVYHAMTEPRPHRDALPPLQAAAELRSQISAGLLDGDVVDAVLSAAGHSVPRKREWPTGLTGREVEVLRLVAGGLTKRQIADRLIISPSTVDHHIRHIYNKIGVSSRAAATLFAVQHGLLDLAHEE